MVTVKNISVIFIIAYLLSGALCGCESILFDNQSAIEGTLKNFRIGETKSAVLEKIKSKSIIEIGATPAKLFYATSANPDAISDFTESEDIAVRSAGAVALFGFENGVSKLKSGPLDRTPAEVFLLEGESMKDFLKQLRILLLRDDKAAAYPLLPMSSRIKVSVLGDSTTLNAFAERFDGWEFVDKSDQPSGARYQLSFSQGKLVKIEYFRIRTSLNIFP